MQSVDIMLADGAYDRRSLYASLNRFGDSFVAALAAGLAARAGQVPRQIQLKILQDVLFYYSTDDAMMDRIRDDFAPLVLPIYDGQTSPNRSDSLHPVAAHAVRRQLARLADEMHELRASELSSESQAERGRELESKFNEAMRPIREAQSDFYKAGGEYQARVLREAEQKWGTSRSDRHPTSTNPEPDALKGES